MINRTLPLTETVTPADEAAVVETVREAAAAGTPVYPIGGAVDLDYGAMPQQPGVGLSLAALDQVIDHAADDMTITVESGITVRGLAARLDSAGQRLPIDVRAPDRATLGGMVATNQSGPRRYGCGTLRDYVIGFRAVDGRGVSFCGGGRVVKNAAGYDLCKLMVGSLGTLGVLTQVTLMVRPKPETSALVVCEVPNLDTAEQLLGDLVRSQTRPVAIELLAGPATHTNPSIGPMLESNVAQLVVGFEGSQAEVDWMVEQLRSEWTEAGIDSPITVDRRSTDLLWQWLAGLSANLQINLLPSATVGIVAELLDWFPGCSIQSHAGNGVVRVDLSSFPADRFVETLRERIRPIVTAAGGHCVVLSPPEGVVCSPDDVWGSSGKGAAVMRAIKDRFDPNHLLNPGRLAFSDA